MITKPMTALRISRQHNPSRQVRKQKENGNRQLRSSVVKGLEILKLKFEIKKLKSEMEAVLASINLNPDELNTAKSKYDQLDFSVLYAEDCEPTELKEYLNANPDVDF